MCSLGHVCPAIGRPFEHIGLALMAVPVRVMPPSTDHHGVARDRNRNSKSILYCPVGGGEFGYSLPCVPIPFKQIGSTRSSCFAIGAHYRIIAIYGYASSILGIYGGGIAHCWHLGYFAPGLGVSKIASKAKQKGCDFR